MARVDGAHGPVKKPTIGFIDEWSKLKGALSSIRKGLEGNAADKVPYLFEEPGYYATDLEALLDQVPRLMDAYAELWELMEGVIKAREQQEASKNDLYVPDAAEMVANANRTRR